MGLVTRTLRTVLRARWRSYAGIVVLLGVLGGLTLFAFAGARRTQSSYPRFLRAVHASTLSATVGFYDPTFTAKVAALPQVVHSASYVSFNAFVLTHGRLDTTEHTEFSGTFDGRYYRQDRFTPTHGRRPDLGRVNEVAVNEIAAHQFGYRVGQRLELGLYTQDQAANPSFFVQPPPPGRRVTVKIVGVGLFPDEVLQDDSDRTPRALMTPAFTALARPNITYAQQGLVLARGAADVPAVEREYSALAPPGTSIFRETADDEFHALRATRPLSMALASFGVVVGLAALLLVLQAIARALRADAPLRATMRALGAPPRIIAAGALAAPVLAVATGTALAVLLAWAASPAMPIGRVGPVDPSRGANLDLAVAGWGAAALLVLLPALAAWWLRRQLPHRLAGKAGRPRRPSRLVAAASAAGLSASAVSGLRFALEPVDEGAGAGRGWSVIGGAAVAVAALVAAATFGGSLDVLVHHPRLYGWNWDIALVDGNGYGNFDGAKIRDLLESDPDIASWSGGYFGSDRIGGVDVPLIGMDAPAAVGPPVVAGRAPVGPGEAMLGAATAARIHRKVGDTLVLQSSGTTRRLKVVGITTLPALGIIHGEHTSLGVGALVPRQFVPGYDRDITNSRTGDFGPNVVLVRLRPGVDPARKARALQVPARSVADFASADALVVQRPAEIVNSASLRSAPLILALALFAGETVSLVLALSSSVRRRRGDVAILKVLGLTRRQVRATVSWQSTTAVTLGLMVGVPAGAVVGRRLWDLFATQLHVVPHSSVPGSALVAVAAAAVVTANLVAAAPARYAGSVRPTALDQTE